MCFCTDVLVDHSQINNFHYVYHNYATNSLYTRIIKNIFNKNERRCRDVKTQKACKQGWEANIGPKIKQTTSIYPT